MRWTWGNAFLSDGLFERVRGSCATGGEACVKPSVSPCQHGHHLTTLELTALRTSPIGLWGASQPVDLLLLSKESHPALFTESPQIKTLPIGRTLPPLLTAFGVPDNNPHQNANLTCANPLTEPLRMQSCTAREGFQRPLSGRDNSGARRPFIPSFVTEFADHYPWGTGCSHELNSAKCEKAHAFLRIPTRITGIKKDRKAARLFRPGSG